MPKSAREAALKVLERCRRDNAFSDALIGSAINDEGLSGKDSALCARLCYGVLQNSILCDFYIDSFVTGKSVKIEPKVRDILRLSVYQIIFLDKIPPHAAVSEGVSLCKKSGFSRASGFVNAVLRKIVSSLESLPEIPTQNFSEFLSIKYSTPLPLVFLLLNNFDTGFVEELLKANNSPAPMVIQVNTIKTSCNELFKELSKSGLNCREHDYLPNCIELFDTGNVAELPSHKEGLFYVQDTAARLSVLAASPKPGDSVLDACSAPGGKSFAAALMMQNTGKIVSCDLHEKKLSRIEDGAHRLGITTISTKTMDAAFPDKAFFNTFDLVIADAPCSGLGVIRKKPDIRYKDPESFSDLPGLQLSILNGLAPCVKSGGVLLYSTCTVLPDENERLVSRFLESHPDFSPEGFELPAPIGLVDGGMLSLYPHTHGTDGFFICRLRKTNEN